MTKYGVQQKMKTNTATGKETQVQFADLVELTVVHLSPKVPNAFFPSETSTAFSEIGLFLLLYDILVVLETRNAASNLTM